MDRPPPILDIRGLRKSFKHVEVLRGIDLAVLPQELVFIIGPSGSGKSTLLRCCNRLEEPTAGAICIGGHRHHGALDRHQRIRRQIGMVFQSFNLYPHMTALGNVTLALSKVLGKPRVRGRAARTRRPRSRRALRQGALAPGGIVRRAAAAGGDPRGRSRSSPR